MKKMADVRVKDQSDQYHTEGHLDLIRRTKYFDTDCYRYTGSKSLLYIYYFNELVFYKEC